MIGHELSAAGTIKASARRYLGVLPGCLAIGGADIGEATLEDGTVVLTTWGRNLSREEQEWYIAKTTYRPIWLSADNGAAELVIAGDEAEVLRSILIAHRDTN